MNQTDVTGLEKTGENGFEPGTSMASPTSGGFPAHKGSLLLPALLLLLVGGLIGYVIGRQSVNQAAVEPAAAGPAANAIAAPVSATTSPNNNTSTAPTSVPVPAGQPVTVPLSNEPAMGSPDAPITIVEYSDFQCPFCLRHFEQTLPQLQQYIDAGQIRYVFKDFPIHSIHPQAQKAHESARCARELDGDDAFWTMHDLLFANQEQWANNSDHVEVYKSLAGEMGLDQEAFDECLASGRYADAVNVQVAEGIDLAVQGTPTFFINGQRLVGAQPFAVFQQLIETLTLNDEVSLEE